MKSNPLMFLRRGGTLIAALVLAAAARAGEKVGVYDSRVVAYACFLAPEHQSELRAWMAEGKAAKERGDTARHEELKRQIIAEQQALHLQVFSTAPAPDALARLGNRAAAVTRETGVQRLVSKWDTDALRDTAEADRVDVTELLIRDCPLSEKQRQTVREIAAKAPLPLWQAKVLNFFGRL
jgi:hypothetical protein